jgi:hypothetical protein
MKANRGIIKEVLPVPSRIKETNERIENIVNEANDDAKTKVKNMFEEIINGYANIEALANAGEKLKNKAIDAYMSAEDIDTMVLAALAAFASAGEMEEYLGLNGNYNKEQAAQAAINKIGKAMYYEQTGELTLEERDEEIKLIRVVTDILMAASEDGNIKNMINEIKDEQGVRALQILMPREIKVNTYIVAEAMAEKVSIDDNVMTIGEFEIDITKIKTHLEKKEPKFSMFNKKNEDLMNLIAEGMRGKDAASFSPMLRNARAVAAAA